MLVLALPARALAAPSGTPANAPPPSGSPPTNNWKPPQLTPSGGTTARIVVHFSSSTDLAAAKAMPGWTARGSYVAGSLQGQAAQSHATALGLVKSHPGAQAQDFWIS